MTAFDEYLDWYAQVGVLTADPIDVELLPANIQDACLRGGKEHRWLCRLAASWLLRQGLEFETECWYPAGIADVACRSQHLAIECGDTASIKVIDALARGWSVLLVPYRCVPTGASGRFVGTLYKFSDDWLAKSTNAVSVTSSSKLFWVMWALQRLLVDRDRRDAFEGATNGWLERTRRAAFDNVDPDLMRLSAATGLLDGD